MESMYVQQLFFPYPTLSKIKKNAYDFSNVSIVALQW